VAQNTKIWPLVISIYGSTALSWTLAAFQFLDP
jgi:hypothetical protein